MSSSSSQPPTTRSSSVAESRSRVGGLSLAIEPPARQTSPPQTMTRQQSAVSSSYGDRQPSAVFVPNGPTDPRGNNGTSRKRPNVVEDSDDDETSYEPEKRARNNSTNMVIKLAESLKQTHEQFPFYLCMRTIYDQIEKVFELTLSITNRMHLHSSNEGAFDIFDKFAIFNIRRQLGWLIEIMELNKSGETGDRDRNTKICEKFSTPAYKSFLIESVRSAVVHDTNELEKVFSHDFKEDLPQKYVELVSSLLKTIYTSLS